MFKKLLVLLVIVSMMFTSILTGCSNSSKDESKSNDSSTTAAEDKTEEKAQEEKKEPGEVSILTIDSPYIQKNYDQGLPVLKKIEENLNIKIKWQLMPSAGLEDTLKIRLSSGTDMPDIFATWQQSPEVLAKNGAVLALSDYFDSTLKNVKKVLENDSVLKTAVTSPDGKVYFLPSKDMAYNTGWLIREDWLEKLNLEMPETLDDFYNVLKAFRDNDPNENGEKDEIPLAINYLNYTWFYMMHFFGLNTAAPWDWLGKDENGKMYVYLTRPEFKETIKFVNKLYTEKLLNQDILNVSGESYKKIIGENRVGITYNSINSTYINMIQEANPDVDPKFKVMLPIKSSSGYRGVRSYNSIDGEFFVSSKGKNTEDALRLIDYIFGDPEGAALINWGIKGETYIEENGEKKFTDFVTSNPDGLTPMNALISSGVWPVLPKVVDVKARGDIKNIDLKDQPWVIEGIKLYEENNIVGEPEKRYRFTSDESDQIKAIKSKLETYINETLAKMIVGNQSIDDFDKFVKELEEKEINKIAEIYQNVEDRSK